MKVNRISSQNITYRFSGEIRISRDYFFPAKSPTTERPGKVMSQGGANPHWKGIANHISVNDADEEPCALIAQARLREG